MRIFKKLSFFMLMVAAQVFASDSVMAFDEFSQSVQSNVDRTFPMIAIFIFITVVILIIIIVVLYEINRSKKTKQELQAIAWKKFYNRAESLKLSEQNINLLKDIINEADLQDPSTITRSPHVFETSIKAYYDKKNIESIPTQTLEQIRELRIIFEFLPMPKDIAYTSTRQFDKDEKCLIQIPATLAANEKPIYKGMCLVTSVSESEWSVAKPEGFEVKAKTPLLISLNRPGDAEYAFNVSVISDSSDLVLSHTNKLRRTQQRNWVRVEVNIPVEITQIEDGKIGDIFSGKIVDMSGGGFGLSIPSTLPNKSKLILNFDLPGQGIIKDLPVNVVRVVGKMHSVAFAGDFYQIQEQIIQYIFEKQRQDSSEKH